ncbi:MAG TPA: S1/P1 nuclease [Gemmataceae bacterium]
MRKLLVCLLLLFVPPSAWAWNDKGHMVTARLAWRQLTEDQRSQVVAILKKHPHYQDYLAASRPEGFGEDEWVFMRAATWADWARGRRAFDHPTWHYINYPIVPEGSAVDPTKHEPPARQENIVNQLAVCMDKIKGGTDEEKALYMTWLFHLVGDIHQPLHCTAVFSERFPEGDRGGNLALIRISSKPLNLHFFWDGLLGRGLTAGDIGKDVQEIEQVIKDRDAEVRTELQAHPSFESWAREGLELSKKVVYLNGQLKVAVSGSNEEVPEPPAEYPTSCGKVARVQIGKAGLRLAEQLKKLCP